eukprot:310987-Amorphochlora_amoeboformis.AAC.1
MLVFFSPSRISYVLTFLSLVPSTRSLSTSLTLNLFLSLGSRHAIFSSSKPITRRQSSSLLFNSVVQKLHQSNVQDWEKVLGLQLGGLESQGWDRGLLG